MIASLNGMSTLRGPVFFRIGLGLLIAWSAVGLFMDGENVLDKPVAWLVALGGGIAGERLQVACRLLAQGHGHQGVVLTGGNLEGFVTDRDAFIEQCGIPKALIRHWSNPTNTLQEISELKYFLASRPGSKAIVVSDSLHMPRLRYLRDRFALQGLVYFRQSKLGGRLDMEYVLAVVKFWFREPLAYGYYRIIY